MSVDLKEVERLARLLLIAIGEDPDREGLKDTPRRYAKWWSEFIDYEPGKIDTCFESMTTDQMVIVRNIKVWSLCEHHLLPFWAEVSIGYIATTKVLGLSKFARIAEKWAHSLQIQEQLVDQIAGDIERLADTEHVAVIAEGAHLCMQMRGVKSQGLMVSSVMKGLFKSDPRARAEFIQLVR